MAEGIQERHRKGCPGRTSGRCNCKRSYRASAYHPRTKKNAYSGWRKDKAAVVKWQTRALHEIEAHSTAGISAPGDSPLLSEAWHDWIAGAESGRFLTTAAGSSSLDIMPRAVPVLAVECPRKRVHSTTRDRVGAWVRPAKIGRCAE